MLARCAFPGGRLVGLGYGDPIDDAEVSSWKAVAPLMLTTGPAYEARGRQLAAAAAVTISDDYVLKTGVGAVFAHLRDRLAAETARATYEPEVLAFDRVQRIDGSSWSSSPPQHDRTPRRKQTSSSAGTMRGRHMPDVKERRRAGTPVRPGLVQLGLLLGTAVAVLATSCGSTAHQDAARSEPGGNSVASGLEQGDEVNDAPVGANDGGRVAPLAGRRTNDARLRPATPARHDAPAPAPADVAATPASGRVLVGIGYSNATSLAAACTALGAANEDCSDAESIDIKRWAEKTVAWINAHGGLGGRQVVPLYFEMDVTRQLRPEDRAQMEQEMCAYWTEDNHVFAMIPTTNMEGILLECARRAGVIFLSTTSAESVVDAGRFAEVGSVWYRPAWILADRREEAVVATLDDAGWFDGARVGLMIHDRAENLRSAAVLKRALAARGVDVVSEIRYPDVVESPWSTYALKLQADGVTHILYGSGHSSGPVWFLAQQAESQGYRPRYGFGTDQEPSGVASIVGDDIGPRSTVVGWSPFQDTGVADYEPYPLNDADRLCHEIIGTRAAHPAYCDGLFFLKRVLDTGARTSVAEFSAAAERLGRTYQSPYTYEAAFGPGRHDGAAAVAVLGWNGDCSCFRPTSGPHSIR